MTARIAIHCQYFQYQWAGVGQAPMDETAGSNRGLSVIEFTTGLLGVPMLYRADLL